MTITGQDCLQNTPEYGDKEGGEGVERLEEEVERLQNDNVYLIPAYTFSCHGNVTQWGACIKERRDNTYTIFFIVFRPSSDPALPNCYSLVGIDRLKDAIPTNSCVTLDVLVNQTSVQPGDVVGISPMPNRVSYGIEIDVNVTGITAWYGSADNFIIGGDMCPYRVSDGNLNLSVPLAPVITAVVGEPCVWYRHNCIG